MTPLLNTTVDYNILADGGWWVQTVKYEDSFFRVNLYTSPVEEQYEMVNMENDKNVSGYIPFGYNPHEVYSNGTPNPDLFSMPDCKQILLDT